jgi:hypothetical protein
MPMRTPGKSATPTAAAAVCCTSDTVPATCQSEALGPAPTCSASRSTKFDACGTKYPSPSDTAGASFRTKAICVGMETNSVTPPSLDSPVAVDRNRGAE